MLYGFSGASRSGKSTTAKAVSELLGLEYMECQTSVWAKEAGFDLVSPTMTVEERIDAQITLLGIFIAKLEKSSRPLIVDRTPIDMLAYTASEVTMHSVDPETSMKIKTYYDACLDMTAKYFDQVMIFRPLPVYVSEEGKHPPSVAYQWHTQYVIEGAMSSLSPRMSYGIVYPNSLDARVQSVADLIGNRITEIGEHIKVARFH